jgi:histidine triad (HIT) family protein
MDKNLPTENDCIFCKIIAGEIPSEIRYEDEKWLAFDNMKKTAPEHILLIPKKHYTTLEDVEISDRDFHADLLITARKIAKKIEIVENYKMFINVGQKVQAIHHVHLHIYGGWKGDKPNQEIKQESLDLINQ